jgi:hypothetical protein
VFYEVCKTAKNTSGKFVYTHTYPLLLLNGLTIHAILVALGLPIKILVFRHSWLEIYVKLGFWG